MQQQRRGKLGKPRSKINFISSILHVLRGLHNFERKNFKEKNGHFERQKKIRGAKATKTRRRFFYKQK